MSGGIIANVRLVKCPKCSRVLPELADVPVYKCGGCGAVLQAKNRKAKIEDTKSELSESAITHLGDLGHASIDTKSSSSSQNGNHSPVTGNSREESNYYPEKYSADCISETVGGNISNEHCDNEVQANGQSEPHDNASDFKRRGKDEIHEARARSLSVTNNLPNESPSPGSQATNELDHTDDSPTSFSRSDSEKLPFNSRNDSTVAVDTLSSDAVQCQSKKEVQGSLESVNHERATSCGNSDVGADELLIKRNRRPIVATGITHHLNLSVPSKGIDGGPDSAKEAFTSSIPAGEALPSIAAKSLSPKEERPAYEINYSDANGTQSRRIAGQYQKSSPNGYDSVNELEAIAATEPSSSELFGTVGKISVSATTRSGHEYDGSISSYEDQDDQIYKQTYREVNYVENDGKRNFNTNKVPSIIAMQQQAREFFSSEKNHKISQGSSWSPRESGEFMRHPIPNHIPLEAEIYSSRAPFNTKGYENGGPNSDFCDGVQSDSGIYSTDKLLPYTEKERIELLKMVYELKEEISRAPTNTGNGDRRNPPQFWSGRQMPVPHARREFMDEADLQPKFPRYPFTRSEQGTNWPHPQNHSRMPFSGEVTNQHRYHDRYSCQHRRSVDQHFSPHLAPSVCSTSSLNNGPQRVNLYSGEQFPNPYSSSTSSPQRYMESDVHSRVRDVTYDDQRLMESGFPSRVRDSNYIDQRLMERYVEASLANSNIATDRVGRDEIKMFKTREKQPQLKHHTRPIAGGAPFITCHQCWNLLQLPADSFLFRRRFHKLMCGSCSKILQFALEDRTHIVPQVYIAPPNEVRSSSPVNFLPSYENISPHGIQMSGSDQEFGNSLGRSFSTTERKQEYLAASASASQATNGGGRNSSPGDSSEISEGKKKLFSKKFFSKDKRPVEIAGSSTNRTLNIENYSSESAEPKSRTGSPLHRLMGYTSISQVFRGPSKGVGESFRNKSAR